ncbi:Na+/H+ antiporter subunit A [Evansella cellulosilytica]|uniref:Monovalent cation/H+ antiporter, subunit 1 n=1 Tax=Evansella cellulosilytica (strain ATCC 21833 / DSM 2522 / FERM P-1141 / JCM 9156 / N-4) TaxID=649639 RepID=E6TW04_EVAC2|nr:Na+/H+ antiporter subunit A [Evansella cellulosilytica]ADU29827.1 monovalent cation/H+ antiporter, subunit 1 [Evansella cellulosilytica DSM 2522]
MSTLHYLVLAPFALAILIPFVYRWFRHIHTGWFVLPLPLVLFVYLFTQYLPFGGEFKTAAESVAWIPSIGVNFDIYLDGLSLLFALLITGIGTLVVLYSIYYIANKKDEPLNNFYVYLLMFMGAMLGVVLSDNLIVIYVFWEITSLSSALLIAYWFHKEKSRYGAQKSMLITVAGGFAMLAGFSLLYIMTGTFSIQAIIEQAGSIMTHSLFIPAMLLVLLGAFTKSAQFPFHIWLPDAMEAPTPVSAYLHSATMVKAGIYLVARFTPVFAGTPEWFWILTSFGLMTLIWGSISAVRQKDLKGILAFSTISQLGLIMSLLGLGSAAVLYNVENVDMLYATAIIAAVFHLINHATFKGSLFMVVGIIDHETGTRDIRKLGGLMTIMPITFTISLIGIASMAGLPPFNGFLSKEMFFTGVLNATTIDFFNVSTWGILFPIVAWIASVFTFVYCMIMFFRTFTGKHQPEKLEKEAHEAPMGLLISPIVLASLVVIFGLFPNILSYSIIEPTVQSILPNYTDEFYVNIYHWHGLNTELFMTVAVVLFGALVFLNLKRWQEATFFLKERDPLNRLYDGGLDGLVAGSQRVTNLQLTGLLRDYFAYMMVFMILLLGWTIFRFDAIAFDFVNVATVSPYLWVITLVLIASVISVPFISNRIGAIIVVGVIGFIIALLFVVLRAPDLALTQLLVETVMVVLFLLCFYHLPELKKEKFTPRFKLTNLVISIGVGLVVTLTAFSAHAMRHDIGVESISQFFIEASKPLAGGYNMVNVILVDFRGLDTLLEVLVLAVAALGVVTMIKLKMKGGEDV